MSKKRIRMLSILLSLILLIGIVGGVWAYFTDSDEVVNHFTVGDFDIDLDEEWDPDDGEDMVPGDTVKKVPVVTATDGDGYLRIIMSFLDKDGKVITDAERISMIEKTLYYDPVYDHNRASYEAVVNTTSGHTLRAGKKQSLAELNSFVTASKIQNIYNRSDLELVAAKSSAGVYVFYYKGGSQTDRYIFEKGKDVTLFNYVVIPTEWDKAEMQKLGDYSIRIYAEGIQAANFANHTEAFAALDVQTAP